MQSSLVFLILNAPMRNKNLEKSLNSSDSYRFGFAKARLQTIPEENAKAAAACSNLPRFCLEPLTPQNYKKKTNKMTKTHKNRTANDQLHSAKVKSCTFQRFIKVHKRFYVNWKFRKPFLFELPSLQHVSPRLYAWDSPSLTKKTTRETSG